MPRCFRSALLGAISLAAVCAQAQEIEVREPPVLPGVYGGGAILECAQPEYPREALRYELEGRTQVSLLIGDDGKVHGKRVLKSSGWKMLDDATTAFLSACRFSPITRDGKPAGAHWKAMEYVWTLHENGEPLPVPPSIRRENCPAADRIVMVSGPSGGSGILLRFLTSAQGNVFGVKLETSSGDRTIDMGAIRALERCQFIPAMQDGKPGPGNGFARYQPEAGNAH